MQGGPNDARDGGSIVRLRGTCTCVLAVIHRRIQSTEAPLRLGRGYCRPSSRVTSDDDGGYSGNGPGISRRPPSRSIPAAASNAHRRLIGADLTLNTHIRRVRDAQQSFGLGRGQGGGGRARLPGCCGYATRTENTGRVGSSLKLLGGGRPRRLKGPCAPRSSGLGLRPGS